MFSRSRSELEPEPSPTKEFSSAQEDAPHRGIEIRPGDSRFYAVMRRAVQRQCPAWMQSDIEDLVQQSALKLLQRAAKQRDPESLGPAFLYRVAYSVVIDEIRRRRVRHGQPDQRVNLDEGATRDSRDPTQSWVHHAWLRKNVEKCMQTLNDDRRSHLTLKLQGHSVQEIADLLGTDRTRAKNLVYRGLEQLRKCLQRRWGSRDERA